MPNWLIGELGAGVARIMFNFGKEAVKRQYEIQAQDLKVEILKKKKMAERKIWTPEVIIQLIKEDAVLKEIILVKKIKKWSAIARCMVSEYKMYGRTGKQCRERWHNQLDPNINNQEWTREEEEILFQCHNEFGNKWAKIAIRLPGRTDNNIKNHFYSTLRKGIRKLNKTMMDNSEKGAFKEFKGPILSKLITVAEDKFDHKLSISEQLRDKCVDIKVKLIEISKDEVEPKHQQCVQLTKEIVDFNRSFRKRKSKKKKSQIDSEEESYMSIEEKEKDKGKEKEKGKDKQKQKEKEKDRIKQKKPILPTLPPLPLFPAASVASNRPMYEQKPDQRIEIQLLRIDKSNHQQEEIGNFVELPLPQMRKKNSSSFIFRNSPMLTYRFSQPMGQSVDLGGMMGESADLGGGQPLPMVSLDSSAGIKELLCGSQMKNLFTLKFCGNDDSQNLFPHK